MCPLEPVTHLLTAACLSRAGLNRRTGLATLTRVEGQARKHVAAFPAIHVTSAEKGLGIPELRAAILADAAD